MSHIGIEDRWVAENLFKDLYLNQKEVIDYGAGLGKVGYNLRSLYRIESRDFGYAFLRGYEIHQSYIQILKDMGIYDLVECVDITNLLYNYYQCDIALLFHILEHLTKEDAIKLLEKVERGTREIIIIAVPYGDRESKQGRHENERSKHLSSFTVEDFKRRDYQTRVIFYGSRTANLIVKLFYKLLGKEYNNSVIVAWKKIN